MNIVEFIEKFKDVSFYQLHLNVVGSKDNEVIQDEKYQSDVNFKGRAIPFYQKKEDGERELCYVPFDQCSLPIDIQVDCNGLVLFEEDGNGKLVSRNPLPMTQEGGTSYRIHLVTETGEKLGHISLELNTSGDVICKSCFYNNLDFTHQISELVQYFFQDGQIHETVETTYTERNYSLEQKNSVAIYQTDGITTGIKVTKGKLKDSKELLYQSVPDLVDDFINEDHTYFLSRAETWNTQGCIFDAFSLPYENYVIHEDFTKFRKERNNLNSLLRNEFADFASSKRFFDKREIEYYQNPKNDLFYGFVGEYTGNTIYKKDGTTKLIIRTSDSEFNYYTKIDLTGIDPFVGSSPFFDEERDPKYYERIAQTSKTPSFKTKKVNGVEQLVPQNGDGCSRQECLDFIEFQSLFADSFSDLNEIKVGKLLQK